mgnify:CR=1 FL=1
MPDTIRAAVPDEIENPRLVRGDACDVTDFFIVRTGLLADSLHLHTLDASRRRISDIAEHFADRDGGVEAGPEGGVGHPSEDHGRERSDGEYRLAKRPCDTIAVFHGFQLQRGKLFKWLAELRGVCGVDVDEEIVVVIEVLQDFFPDFQESVLCQFSFMKVEVLNLRILIEPGIGRNQKTRGAWHVGTERLADEFFHPFRQHDLAGEQPHFTRRQSQCQFFPHCPNLMPLTR